jgi:hypothetical protein
MERRSASAWRIADSSACDAERLAASQRASSLQLHQCRRQGRTDAVMKVTSEPPALFLARGDEALPRPLQRLGEERGVGHTSHLHRERLEQDGCLPRRTALGRGCPSSRRPTAAGIA